MTALPGRWWGVALAASAPADRPISRRIGSLPIVLFRDESGSIRALEDRCAHRRAPLSLGQRTAEGLIQCPYHGWRYEGRTGKCRAVPNLSADEKVPGNFGVRAFPAQVEDGLVFVWNGAAEPPALQAIDGGDGHALSQGEASLACPHAMFAALILDRPSAVLTIADVEILDDFRWGDPQVVGDHVVSDFGAVRARRRSGRLPSTPPLTLRLSVEAKTAATRILLLGEDGAPLAATFIAAVPDGDMITRLCYTGWAEKEHAISLRPALDAESVAKTRRAAWPDWLSL